MSNVPHAAPRVNFASSMIVEDHLKKVLAKTEGKPWKFTDNKLLPRSQHSPFGDFPPEYMKPKAAGVEPVPHIEAAEQSIAAQGKCKSAPARVPAPASEPILFSDSQKGRRSWRQNHLST